MHICSFLAWLISLFDCLYLNMIPPPSVLILCLPDLLDMMGDSEGKTAAAELDVTSCGYLLAEVVAPDAVV